MRQFARVVGFLSMASGLVLLASPETVRRLQEIRGEYAQLSPAALRLLGGWELLMGGLLVAATTEQAMEGRVGEVAPHELREAA